MSAADAAGESAKKMATDQMSNPANIASAANLASKAKDTLCDAGVLEGEICEAKN